MSPTPDPRSRPDDGPDDVGRDIHDDRSPGMESPEAIDGIEGDAAIDGDGEAGVEVAPDGVVDDPEQEGRE